MQSACAADEIENDTEIAGDYLSTGKREKNMQE